MSEIVSLIVAAALMNNIVLVQLFGVSAFLLSSRRLSGAIELAIFTGLVLFSSTLLSQLLTRVLLEPLGLQALRLITLLVISGGISTVLAVLVRENFPLSFRQQPWMFYLAGGNSAIIGITLSGPLGQLTPLQVIGSSLGTVLGFSAALIGFALLRLRLSTSDVPPVLQGGPIMLISMGIMAMGLLGFAGIV